MSYAELFGEPESYKTDGLGKHIESGITMVFGGAFNYVQVRVSLADEMIYHQMFYHLIVVYWMFHNLNLNIPPVNHLLRVGDDHWPIPGYGLGDSVRSHYLRRQLAAAPDFQDLLHPPPPAVFPDAGHRPHSGRPDLPGDRDVLLRLQGPLWRQSDRNDIGGLRQQEQICRR